MRSWTWAPAARPSAISAGAFHTCARRDDGSVICWGRADDGNGSLGYGNNTNIGDSEPASAGGPLALGDSGPVGPPVQPPPPIVPDTTITEQPKSKLKTKQKKVKVTYEFSSSVAGSTFECALDGAAPKQCTSPKSYKVKKGRHSFSVTRRRKRIPATPSRRSHLPDLSRLLQSGSPEKGGGPKLSDMFFGTLEVTGR